MGSSSVRRRPALVVLMDKLEEIVSGNRLKPNVPRELELVTEGSEIMVLLGLFSQAETTPRVALEVATRLDNLRPALSAKLKVPVIDKMAQTAVELLTIEFKERL